MTLTLISSGDDQALAIRDHLLPLVREGGTLELQRDSIRLLTLRTGAWTVEHWTPFNDLRSEEASSPGYRHAVERQHTRPGLPYGLQLRRAGTTLLSILWADGGEFEVLDFARGSWEAEALAL